MPLKNINSKLKYKTTLKSNIIGRLFNNVTPFSSGGQPFQAYVLGRSGLKVSDALSALMMKFLVYEAGLFSWLILLRIINASFWNDVFGDYKGFIIFGIMTNVFSATCILLAGINKNLVLKIVKVIINLANKIKIIRKTLLKDIDSTMKKLEDSISNCSEQFKKMKNHKCMLLKMYIVSIFQLLVYFAIPFMIYKAFGNSGISLLEVITVQAYLLLVMSFIPTPGSGLGAEGGFALFYKKIFIVRIKYGNIVLENIYILSTNNCWYNCILHIKQ